MIKAVHTLIAIKFITFPVFLTLENTKCVTVWRKNITLTIFSLYLYLDRQSCLGFSFTWCLFSLFLRPLQLWNVVLLFPLPWNLQTMRRSSGFFLWYCVTFQDFPARSSSQSMVSQPGENIVACWNKRKKSFNFVILAKPDTHWVLYHGFLIIKYSYWQNFSFLLSSALLYSHPSEAWVIPSRCQHKNLFLD